MKVEFIKDCPWSYRLTLGQRGRVTKHKQGDTAQVEDVEGEAMVSAGYATQCKPGRKPGWQPEETKVVEPETKKRKKKGGK
jgi:hypothetical protein